MTTRLTELAISTTGNITGNILVGNVVRTDNYQYANGQPFAGAGGTYGNANVSAFLNNFGSNNISTTGNITSGYLAVEGNVYINNSGNNWTWTQDRMSFPSGAGWRSDKVTLDEYISSATDGYLNLETYDATSNVATQLHMEHGVVQLNIFDGGNVTWQFNEDGSLDVPGNIVPNSSNTYSLGNATNQWKDLYVSNNTIYINSVPVTLGAGNVLTVDGNAVLSNDSNTSITTTGNITADYFIGDGSQLTGTLSWVTAPVANTSPGIEGQAAYDVGGNLYICVSANTWSKFTGTTSW